MEKKCFRKLTATWGKDYNIYHNLPFLLVFNGKSDLLSETLEPITLAEEEYELLKKTSIDFTICDKNDTPLVCVEFDGMQDGFNVGTKYYRRDGTSGKNGRRVMTELKLRVAHGSRFPYFVIGSEEFRGLSDTIRLNIADGLIGEVMSQRATDQQVKAGFDPSRCGYSAEEFEAFSPSQQSAVVGDWFDTVEIESDFKHNPIAREVARLAVELHETGNSTRFINCELHDPDKWVWVECGVTSRSNGSATAKVCLPDFKTPYCYFPIHLAIEIGHLLALEQLRLRRRKERKSSRANKMTRRGN
jgi:hypothetical protein